VPALPFTRVDDWPRAQALADTLSSDQLQPAIKRISTAGLPCATTSGKSLPPEGGGLVCVLTAPRVEPGGRVKPCWSFEIVRDRASKRIEAEPRYRKCLHLYHYQIHPRFGFMSARIQTWLPFRIQICLNGREWLARSMDAAGLHYVRRDNCFTWLEHPERAQQLMDRQVGVGWPVLPSEIARSLNPPHETIFAAFPKEYYWSTYQSEWATGRPSRSGRLRWSHAGCTCCGHTG
jgi:hypothetical protein